MIDEYTKFKGTLYNVEGGPKGTGVSYKDVAGVDHALDLIKETVKMLLGGEDYVAMGTRPPRVRVTFYKTAHHSLPSKDLKYWGVGPQAMRVCLTFYLQNILACLQNECGSVIVFGRDPGVG